MTALLALLFLAAAPAHAAEGCDVKALQKTFTEASPTAVPAAYRDLVACDAEAGKKITADAFARMLAGDDSNPAMISAIGIGASTDVRTWILGLEPDQKSRAIAWLGGQCKADPAVEAFFVDAHAQLGASFYSDRWFKGLTDCRTEKIQALLGQSVDAHAQPKGPDDRAMFYAVLQVYARNLGGAAIPKLVELGNSVTDEEQLTYIVSAFADAANVGSTDGIDADAAAKAVAELNKLGEKLPPRAIEQGRTTLLALGAEQVADSYAGWRWKERKVDGNYRYAAVAVTQVTCKNGKKQAYFHHASVSEAGRQWPEQIEALIGEKLEAEWKLHDAASKCKGTDEVKIAMPAEPFTDDAARDAWLEAQRKQFTGAVAGFDKVSEVPHPTVDMN